MNDELEENHQELEKELRNEIASLTNELLEVKGSFDLILDRNDLNFVICYNCIYIIKEIFPRLSNSRIIE